MTEKAKTNGVTKWIAIIVAAMALTAGATYNITAFSMGAYNDQVQISLENINIQLLALRTETVALREQYVVLNSVVTRMEKQVDKLSDP